MALKRSTNLSGDGEAESQIAVEQITLAYQDFNAGAITGTTVTLTANNNGTRNGSPLDFDSTKIVNDSAFIVRVESNGEEKAVKRNGATSFFLNARVTSHTGASVTLNGAPNASANIRIWYRYIQSPTSIENMKSPQRTSLSAKQIDQINSNIYIASKNIVFSQYSTEITANNTDSFIDTGLSCNITPSKSGNKIIVYVAQNIGFQSVSNAVSENQANLRIVKIISGTQSNVFAPFANTDYGWDQLRVRGFYANAFVMQGVIDTNSTDQITIKTQFSRRGGDSPPKVQFGQNTSTILAQEVPQ